MHDPNHAINMCKLSYIGQVGLPFGCYELDIHGAGSMSTRFCTPESAKLKAETSKHVLWWRFTFSKASLCPQTTLYHTYRSENPQTHPATSDSKPSQTSSYHMVFHYFSTNLSNKDSESGPTTLPFPLHTSNQAHIRIHGRTWRIIPGLGYVVNIHGDPKCLFSRVVGALLKNSHSWRWS